MTVRCRRLGARPGSTPPLVTLELRDDGGLVLGRATQATSELGWDGARGRARAPLPHRPPAACRRPLSPPRRADRRRRAAGRCTRSTTRCGCFVFPLGPGDGRGALRRGLVDGGDGTGRANWAVVSTRACPDWPQLMEIVPDLQFRHYTLREVQLPTDAFVRLEGVDLDTVAICCDLEAHVYNPDAHRSARSSRRSPARTGATCNEAAHHDRLAAVGRAAPPVVLLRAVATVVVPFRGSDPKRRLEPISDGDRVRHRRGDARRCSRRRARRRARVRRRARRAGAAGRRRPRCRSAPRAGRRRSRRRSTPRSSAGSPAPYLVVNADLPCVTRARPAGARRGDPRRRARARAGGRRDDERARRSPTRACSARSTAPAAPSVRRARRRRGVVEAPNLDRRRRHDRRSRTGLPRGSARTRRACSPRCAARPLRERRRSLGRRRRRPVPARARSVSSIRGDISIIGNVADDLEVLGLHVSPDLDSILYTLAGPVRRGARLGTRRRELARARDGRRARRRVVVPPRRSRSRPASRANAAAARGRDAVRGDRAASRTRSGSRPRCCRRPTTRCARSSRPRPARFRSRPGSSRAATATRSTPSTTRARPKAVAAPGVLEALHGADLIVIAPEQPVRLDRPDPRGRRDPRGARRAPRPVRRRQPARRRPRRQGARRPDAARGSPAARRRRTSPPVTTG